MCELIKKVEGEVLKNIVDECAYFINISGVVQREDYVNLNGFTACLQNFSKIEQTFPLDYHQPLGFKNILKQNYVDLNINL